ncbi:N-6 DNA methylase [Corynebacterium aquilae]|uniref:DNA methylase adenine-specific domain-containing protein n=1 Tax=Corynebacterium aquilae DSM 44791 TaxID=1431546 RepID=A0A1L7CEW5_9CORY|nr:N-6 DNA methylase [Corynebacterium aquilae]APT84402.1 hypothetical protein CAQU_04185 [Corynebacterium aquilae DSM 44791]
MTNPTPQGTLALKDIAALAGVSRAAVSNWRSRHEDFPAPAPTSTDRKPVFNYNDVVAWLEAHDQLDEKSKAALKDAQFKAIVRPFAKSFDDPLQSASLVLAALAVRKWSHGANTTFNWSQFLENPSMEDLQAAFLAEDFPVELPEKCLTYWPTRFGREDPTASFADLIHGLESLGVDDYPALSRLALDFFLSTGGRGRDSWYGHPASAPATLLAQAAASTDVDSPVVYDPTGGIGGVFAELAAIVSEPNHDTSFADFTGISAEISPYVVMVAVLRTYLEELPLQVLLADSLTSDDTRGLDADIVVSEGPFGMVVDAETRDRIVAESGLNITMRHTAENCFLLHSYNSARADGHAYVLAPPMTGFEKTSRSLRETLVATGAVEAVIQLPSAFFTYTRVAPMLWVLKKPGATASDPSFVAVDASQVKDPETQVGDWLRALRAGQDLPVPHARVGLAELVTAGGEILPDRLAAAPVDPEEVSAQWVSARDTVIEAVSRMGDAPNLEFGDVPPRAPRARTVKELLDEGALKKLRPVILRRDADESSGTKVLPFALQRKPDLEPKFVGDSSRWDALQVGDVLVHKIGQRIHVITEQDLDPEVLGDATLVASEGWLAFRVTLKNLDPVIVAAAIAAHLNAQSAVEKSRVGVPSVDAVKIPLYDAEDQARIVSQLAQLNQMADAARQLSSLTDDAHSAYLAALAAVN